MKKAISWIGVLVLLSSFCIAGSIEDLQYKDQNLFWDNTRTTNDYDVNIDADTLEGQSVSSLTSNIANSVKPKGEPGMGKNDLSYWLTGSGYLFDEYDNLMEYLFDVFEAKYFERMELRMDRIEAIASNPGLKGEALDLQIGLVTAKRTGEKVKVDGHVCSWHGTFGECVKTQSLKVS